MLSVDVPPYGTGTQPITYHVRVNAGYGHLEAGFRRIFDGGFAGWMYVDGVLSPGDYALTDQFNTNAIYYSEYKFVEDAAPPPPPPPPPPQTYNLTIRTGVGGSTDPLPGIYTYNVYEKVTVQAKPSTGYRFKHWADWHGNPFSTEPTITLTMTGDIDITAVFEPGAPPPPPTVPLDVLVAVAGAALLLVLGGLASGLGTAIFQQWFTG